MVAPMRRIGRWLSPTTLVLAGLCFTLPFASVACSPSGYARSGPGGTTTYTGFDLVLGDEPAVTPPDQQRPLPPGQEDRLWPQPAAIAVLLLVLGGVAYSIVAREARVRRGGVAVLGGVAATSLLVNQALVESELAVRVGSQLTQPLPAGTGVRDLVHTGGGFGLCLVLLVLASASNAIGWWRARPRPALVAGDPERTAVVEPPAP